VKIVKIYGLERSGTNYLQWLLEHNLEGIDIFTNQLGWKHGPVAPSLVKTIANGFDSLTPPEINHLLGHRWFKSPGRITAVTEQLRHNQIVFVIVVKNPLSWYSSISRYKKFSFHPLRPRYFDEWRTKHQGWLRFAETRDAVASVIKFEDLLNDPQSVIHGLATKFSISFKQGDFKNVRNRIAPGYRLTKAAFNPDFYVKEDFKRMYSASDILSMKQRIPEELLMRMGYSLDLSVMT